MFNFSFATVISDPHTERENMNLLPKVELYLCWQPFKYISI